ncbi:hypothetical protein IWX90DRAFT_305086 [Phyllosticta citrichinensis]|uniref:Secreted peptide n=1 Tax=Phyllosticta citrichinensis TaxID=1130410 RepID=A0ABR1XLG8_9PEZI
MGGCFCALLLFALYVAFIPSLATRRVLCTTPNCERIDLHCFLVFFFRALHFLERGDREVGIACLYLLFCALFAIPFCPCIPQKNGGATAKRSSEGTH